jgi:hypothetical protein
LTRVAAVRFLTGAARIAAWLFPASLQARLGLRLGCFPLPYGRGSDCGLAVSRFLTGAARIAAWLFPASLQARLAARIIAWLRLAPLDCLWVKPATTYSEAAFETSFGAFSVETRYEATCG